MPAARQASLQAPHVGQRHALQLREVIAVSGVDLGLAQTSELAALPVRAEVLHVDEQERRLRRHERDLAAQGLVHCAISRIRAPAARAARAAATVRAIRPGALPRSVADQVLADLEADVEQPAPLAVDRQGVVGLVVDRVRQFVADVRGRVVVQDPEQRAGEAGVAIVQQAEPPRPAAAVVHRGEAVHRDQNRRHALRASLASRIRSSVSW